LTDSLAQSFRELRSNHDFMSQDRGFYRRLKGLCFTPLLICAGFYFWSCDLRWRSTECLLLPCFNALADVFAVTNCSVLALSAVFCSGLLTWSADNLCSLQWHKDALYKV